MLATTGNLCLRSQALCMYKHTKIEGPRFQRNNFLLFFISDVIITSEIKKVIYMAHHFKPCRNQTACLSQDPFAHSESLQHPIIVVLLIKILVFFNHSVVFTCSKVNNAFKRSSYQVQQDHRLEHLLLIQC